MNKFGREARGEGSSKLVWLLRQWLQTGIISRSLGGFYVTSELTVIFACSEGRRQNGKVAEIDHVICSGSTALGLGGEREGVQQQELSGKLRVNYG